MAGQLWAVDSLGGYMYSKNLSKKLRTAVQPMLKFRQFCDVSDNTADGKGHGDTFTWDIAFNLNTQGTVLTETNTIPETSFKIAQATGTLYEYGNAIPWTGKLEAMSQFEVRKPVMTALKNDMGKVLDTLAHAAFNKTPLIVVSSATDAVTLYTNSTATGTASTGLLRGHVRAIHDLMRERNIPYYDADSYVCIAHPTTFTDLKANLESVNQYVTEGYTKIIKGELGKFENVRFVEQNNVAKSNYTNTDWAFFFGEETAIEGIAVPEEMRAKIPQDYGRSKGLAWYYLGGFEIMHNWGSADTGAANSRIVKWASQA